MDLVAAPGVDRDAGVRLLEIEGGHPSVYGDVSTILTHRPRDVALKYLRELVENGLGKRIMFGASDGRSYNGVQRWGVSVFDFAMPKTSPESTEKPAADFVGFARIPGLRGPAEQAVAASAASEAPKPKPKSTKTSSRKKKSSSKKSK